MQGSQGKPGEVNMYEDGGRERPGVRTEKRREKTKAE